MKLRTTRHPDRSSEALFERLVGIDEQKVALLATLELLLDRDRYAAWRHEHHGREFGLGFLVDQSSPLIVLSGDVGSGKTALATSVGSALARRLDRRVTTVESPSDIRGTGLVGELSARITETFAQARSAIGRDVGILLIDEGDDLATSREQLQAHHEDRAGVNVLIKEIDRLASDGIPLAVVLSTNRGEALDPALRRRASLNLSFGRPRGNALVDAWRRLLVGIPHDDASLGRLVNACEARTPPYSYSDLAHRVGHRALMSAYGRREAVGLEDLIAAVHVVEPSPVFGDYRGE